MIRRHLRSRLIEATRDTPAVFLQGARQTGKSTLLRSIAAEEHPARYVSLDDATTLAAARGDPSGFIAGIEGAVVIDEIQLCPELLFAIKREIDEARKPGRFLLTGSANALVVPEISNALAGRIELMTLRGFSQGEITEHREHFVDWAFSESALPTAIDDAPQDLASAITAGGYPEVIERTSAARRARWFESYVATVIQRDVRELANIEQLTQLPNLLSLCAARAGATLNYAELSRALQMPQSTLKRYLTLLEAVFLIHRLPAWSANLGKRLVRSPKIYLLDTGLTCHLQGIDATAWSQPRTRRGPLVENFVFGELERQLGWSNTAARLYHYRSHSRDEVDFILEDRKGHVVGIEVKASATLQAKDAAPLKKLAGELGSRFVRGIVLYTGSEPVPFAEAVHALPLSALWTKPPESS